MPAYLHVYVLIFISIIVIINTLIDSWRFNLLFLALVYAGVVVIVSTYWPLALAAVKLIAGWMAGAILGLSVIGNKQAGDELPVRSKLVIRAVAMIFVFLVAFSLRESMQSFLVQLTAPALLVSLILLATGLVQLGITSSVFRTMIGLLTFLAGFEIIYSALVESILIAGLLAMVNLGIALVGGYLMLSGEMKAAL